jgi:transcriptional regulator with XRE-family HTH domain
MSGKIHSRVVDEASSTMYIMSNIRRRHVMKQPELGRRILELRKAKGLTQEELVEKCNISVRTLQRIEVGEVTPRSYTIKTILAALDYDVSTVSVADDDSAKSAMGIVRKYVLLETDDAASMGFINSQLSIAWISGVLYFLLGLFEGAAEALRGDTPLDNPGFYIALKLAVLVTFVLFQRGFVILGELFDNYLLRIMSFVLIVGELVTAGYDVASVFYDSTERGLVLGAEAFTYGAILIVYGVSLRRLQPAIGNLAKYAGFFEIAAGCFFLTVVLALAGFFVLMPAELLEIIILYKGLDIARSKSLLGTELALHTEPT